MHPAASPLPLLDDGDVVSLRAAVQESLAWLVGQPRDRVFVFGPRTVTAEQEIESFQRLLTLLDMNPDAQAVSDFVVRIFDVYEAAGGADGSVLFTGYYEPEIEASLTPSPEYATPIYGPPDDVIDVPLEPFSDRFKGDKVLGRLEGRTLVPYWTRAEIESGKLVGHAAAIAWAKDPVALFFTQVQGSGTLKLPDGTEKRIGYASSNGRPYRSIGSLLIAEGSIPREKMSMQAERSWIAEHPGDRARILDYDESYVFFRFLDGPALGNLGRPVTPGRSIAIDTKLFPSGALAFARTDRPIAGTDGSVIWIPLARFVLAQDTGGAIKGAGHVDLFWGRGDEAALAAGMMKQQGRLFFLVPKASSP